MRVAFRADVPLLQQAQLLSEAERDALCGVHSQMRAMEETWLRLLRAQMDALMREDRARLPSAQQLDRSRYTADFGNVCSVGETLGNVLRCLDAIRAAPRTEPLPWLQALPFGLRHRGLAAYLQVCMYYYR
jgi:hypothetical protein